MLNWFRDKFLKRNSVIPRTSTASTEQGTDNTSGSSSKHTSQVMYAEQTSSQPSDKLSLHIIYKGEDWIVSVDSHTVISDLINLALAHFLDPKDSHELTSKYNLISISQKKKLNPQSTVGEEHMKHEEEILLAAKISTGASVPIKLTLKDIKGPSKEDIIAATAHLTKKNAIQVVPLLDCQENLQSEIRKILYSLVEVSAKMLSLSPDAKVVFDGIAARINAKNKKEIDKNAIKYLKDLGFTESQARYALRLKRNRQIEAMEWLLDNSHRVKEDLTEPVDGISTSAGASQSPSSPDDPLHVIKQLLKDIRDFHDRHFEPSPKAMEKLQAMGFSQDAIIEALHVTDNNQVAACEWLCGERDPGLTSAEPGLDTDSPMYKALLSNATIQMGLHNPKILLAFLSILENPSSANLWLNDVDTAPVLAQVFKTYHSEKHIMLVNQQLKLMEKQQNLS